MVLIHSYKHFLFNLYARLGRNLQASLNSWASIDALNPSLYSLLFDEVIFKVKHYLQKCWGKSSR